MKKNAPLDFSVYRGRRVLVTGHTGFKGSWLCEMLLMAGAEVHGYALAPPTKPALFEQLGLSKRLASDARGDVRDRWKLTAAVRRVNPEFVFHLAAQPLVRLSYAEPVETFETNVLGTVYLLNAVRRVFALKSPALNPPCAVVCITTDKCYENDDSGRAFRETDPMGGADPYSASKGACEIAIAAYRRSFFSAPDSPVRVASARAGNVIGGGDWSADRIVPDAMRAFLEGRALVVRNRRSTRPWQHVLEPLAGYLMLGAWLRGDAGKAAARAAAPGASAFNFGPDARAVRTVGDLVDELARHFPEARVEDRAEADAPREAKLLTLDSAKARRRLGWKPRSTFAKTARATADWYRAVAEGVDPRLVTELQIAEYLA